jgi:hypothetical protein
MAAATGRLTVVDAADVAVVVAADGIADAAADGTEAAAVDGIVADAVGRVEAAAEPSFRFGLADLNIRKGHDWFVAFCISWTTEFRSHQKAHGWTFKRLAD